MRSVVVTGSSTGIGWGTAKVLIGHGFHVFGTVRKTADADRLTAEFGPAFTPIFCDVTDEAGARSAAATVGDHLGGRTLLGLVNNAGIAIPGPLMHQPIADFRRQLEVNIVGVLIVTQAFLPLLGADRTRTGPPGRIINMSSVGGKTGAPFIGGYVTSKHGLEGFSESLRRELMLYGIDVIIVAPGAVATPIWDKAEAADVTPYVGTEYEKPLRAFGDYFIADGRKGYPPERIGATVYQALTTPRPKLRYAVVPRPLLNWYLPRLLPRRLLDRIFARNLGFNR